MTDSKMMENKWKCTNNELNNGFLKNESRGQESTDSLLNTSPKPVATVVQVSGSGTQTVMHPRKPKPFKEKFLLGTILILVVVSSISLIMLINATSRCNANGELFRNVFLLLFDSEGAFGRNLCGRYELCEVKDGWMLRSIVWVV